MNALQSRFWLLLTLVGMGLGTPGNAAPPTTKTTPPTANNIMIINTGDAYLPGYRITVGPTGRLRARSFRRNGGPTIRRRDQMLPENYRRFLASLTKAAPVNNLPTGTAAPAGRRRRRVQAPTAPVDFPQIFVVYQGRQSPNLRAVTNANGKALYQEVKQVMDELRLPIPNVP